MSDQPQAQNETSVLLDRTGSMEIIQNSTISSFNVYFDDLRKDETIKFALIQFDPITIVIW